MQFIKFLFFSKNLMLLYHSKNPLMGLLVLYIRQKRNHVANVMMNTDATVKIPATYFLRIFSFMHLLQKLELQTEYGALLGIFEKINQGVVEFI